MERSITYDYWPTGRTVTLPYPIATSMAPTTIDDHDGEIAEKHIPLTKKERIISPGSVVVDEVDIAFKGEGIVKTSSSPE